METWNYSAVEAFRICGAGLSRSGFMVVRCIFEDSDPGWGQEAGLGGYLIFVIFRDGWSYLSGHYFSVFFRFRRPGYCIST